MEQQEVIDKVVDIISGKHEVEKKLCVAETDIKFSAVENKLMKMEGNIRVLIVIAVFSGMLNGFSVLQNEIRKVPKYMTANVMEVNKQSIN